MTNSMALAQTARTDTIARTSKNESVIENRCFDKHDRKTGVWNRFIITHDGKDSLILGLS